MKKLLVGLFALACLAPAWAGLTKDIEYGTAAGESLKLDAYVPEGAGPFPAVILVHGGGWNAGDKSGGPGKGYTVPLHGALEQAGFAWFEVNYRLAPKFRYPACVEDVETAIRWVKAHAKEYHLNLQRLVLCGESAGGHVVGAVAMRADASTRMAAIVPFYGRFDLIDDTAMGAALSPNIAGLVGHTHFNDASKAILREASPLFQAKAGLPPFLLVHGTADDRVPYSQSIKLQARLKELNVPCDLITVQGGVHGMIGWDKIKSDYRDQVVAWLKRTLK